MMDEDKEAMLCVYAAALVLCERLQGREVGREAVAFMMGAYEGASSALSYSGPECIGSVVEVMSNSFDCALEAQGGTIREAWLDACGAHWRRLEAMIAETEDEEER